MVKKLFRYEMLYYVKRLFIFEIILISMSLFTRVIYAFPSESAVYLILSGSATFVFFVVNMLLMVMTTIAIITRFYKNLYSSEGYFTFTLPITETQHLFVKLATAVMFEAIAVLSCVLAVAIATAGELGTEILKAISYLFTGYFKELKVDGVFYIIEFILYVFSASVFGILVYYTCISLGQLSKKARVLVAFGYYLAYCAVVEALSTFFFIASVILPMEPIIKFIEKNARSVAHVYLIGSFVVSSALCVGLFVLNRTIMRKKLNLE